MAAVATMSAQDTAISDGAYTVLNGRTAANRSDFFVYMDQDSGFNHGFPSGFFGDISKITINSGCIDDASSLTGCSSDPTRLDSSRGTVLQIVFAPLPLGDSAGINIEEPEHWGVTHLGIGYDLTGAENLVFDVRSPTGITVQFGVGGCTTTFMTIPSTWTTKTVPLNTLTCKNTPPLNLADLHIVFGIAGNDQHTSTGGTILLDNIRFTPTPTRQTTDPEALSFPVGTQTFGVVPVQNPPIPPDQTLRSVSTIYESAITLIALLNRAQPQDLQNAREIADTLDYALQHENHGDPLRLAVDGSHGLHNAYSDGDIGFLNDQTAPKLGKAGDARLAGFTASSTLCGSSGFCLVLDGATGGNNAFAAMALLAAYKRFADTRYLSDARIIGDWIIGNLSDTTGTGYGGYFLGYPDQGQQPKTLIQGKSTENCADVFSMFMALSLAERESDDAEASAKWLSAADIAGDFVMQMFDPVLGRFNAGTITAEDALHPGSGVCPDLTRSQGNDVLNTCDFADSNTFPTLAMAAAPRYRTQIDWRRPIQYVIGTFPVSVMAGGNTFSGFNIVPPPTSGIAWEFTSQIVETLHFVDDLYSQTAFEHIAQTYLDELGQAILRAPFTDGNGLVASTIQDGDLLPPATQCLNTPFQCVPERVGVAATAWAIYADDRINPFPLPSSQGTDFDLDGKADFAVWRPSLGEWYVIPSANPSSPVSQQWGLPGDIPVPGDYDGDGKTDFAVWRPSLGEWYIIPSGNPSSPVSQQWGLPGDIPVPGDYDGDGKTDFAVWRSSLGEWYIIPSGNPSSPISQQWGLPGDIPVPGDYDGDGRTDLAVWRPSLGEWYIIPSVNPTSPISRQWGLPGDIPVPGDYDGDGRTDLAVWRPSLGEWYIIPSSNPSSPISQQWGLAGDAPVARDFDGDGKTDFAVWRPSLGEWYIIPSATPSSPINLQWGLSLDLPL